MDNTQIIGLRIAYIFIKHYNYRMLTINQLQHELFVVNPSHDQYPVIRIDFSNQPLSANKIAMLKQFMTNQKSLLRGNDFLLTISLSGEPEMYENHEVTVISQEGISKEELFNSFKKLQDVDWEIKQPVEDLRSIVSQLNKQSRQQMTPRNITSVFANNRAVAILSIISLVFYLATVLLNNVTNNPINSLIILGGFYTPFVHASLEIWRFVTAGFLHSNVMHLLANVLALNNIGMIVERIYGYKKILVTALLSIIVGNLFVYIGDTTPLTVGISGGVYGLFGLLIVYSFESGLIRQPAFRMQLGLIVVVNVIVNFLPYVSWLGHLGGLFTGVLLGLVYSRNKQWKTLRNSAKQAFALMIVMLVVLSIVRPTQPQVFPGTDREVIEVLEDTFNLNFYTEPLEENLFKWYESRGILE